MRFSKRIGVFFCIILIAACFMPWTYHADLNKTFTGLFSEKNIYGKPGKFLIFFGVVSALLIIIPRVWAKRIHLFLSALAVGYAIKTYILFTSCYNAYCPDKKYGIYLMMISCIAILIASVFPDINVNSKPANND